MLPTSALIVDFDTPPGLLAGCLSSLERSDERLAEIVVVDNGSTRHRDEAAAAVAASPRARVVHLSSNRGFAGGFEAAAAAARSPLLLAVNSDAVLVDGALEALGDGLAAAGPGCAGVAPKIHLSGASDLLDAVGIGLRADGTAWNIGLGYPDVGQHDRPAEVFGVCFAAALLRADVMERVGGLDRRYFLYQEDVDWCWRARRAGFGFQTIPSATVLHQHAATAGTVAGDLRFLLNEVNLVTTVTRHLPAPDAGRAWARRVGLHLGRAALRRPHARASGGVVARSVGRLPRTLIERRGLNRRFGPPPAIAGRWGDDGGVRTFDPDRRQPLRSRQALAVALDGRASWAERPWAAAAEAVRGGIDAQGVDDLLSPVDARAAAVARRYLEAVTAEAAGSVNPASRGPSTAR